MRIYLISVCMLLLAGCPQHEPAQPGAAASQPGAAIKPVAANGPALTVWADPALLPALAAIAPAFKKIYAPGYRVEAKERGALLARLGQDATPEAPAVLCADQTVLEFYDAQNYVEEGTRRTFAGDRLVLAEHPGQGYKSASLFDIYELRFEYFGLGEPATLAGYFGEQALLTEGGYERIESRIKRYPSTAALVDALKLDEVQMILVPASAAATSGISAWLVIGEDLHEDIRYQAAAGQGRAGEPGVMELLRFLAEDDAVQSKLEGYGLVRREMALVEDK